MQTFKRRCLYEPSIQLGCLMPSLCFKPPLPDADRPTVHLVRYVYSPKAKRSVTHHVGKIRFDADPHYTEQDLVLDDGERLTNAELATVVMWLEANGCPKARQRRAETKKRLRLAWEERVSVPPSPVTTIAEPAWETASQMLVELRQHLEVSGQAHGANDEEWRKATKAQYAALRQAFDLLVKTAQTFRIARSYSRRSAVEVVDAHGQDDD